MQDILLGYYDFLMFFSNVLGISSSTPALKNVPASWARLLIHCEIETSAKLDNNSDEMNNNNTACSVQVSETE